LPVSQNRFRQGQTLFCMVRPIHAPAEMSDSLRNGSFILADRDGHFSFDAHFRQALPVWAHLSFLNLFGVTQIQQPCYPVLAHDLFSRLAQGGDFREVSLALLARIQSFQGRLGFVQALSQSRAGGFRQPRLRPR